MMYAPVFPPPPDAWYEVDSGLDPAFEPAFEPEPPPILVEGPAPMFAGLDPSAIPGASWLEQEWHKLGQGLQDLGRVPSQVASQAISQSDVGHGLSSAADSVRRAAEGAAQSSQDLSEASKSMKEMADVVKVVAIGVGVVAGLGLLYAVLK